MKIMEHFVVYRIEQGEIVPCRIVGSKWIDGRQVLVGYAGDEIDPADCFLTKDQAAEAMGAAIRRNTEEVRQSTMEMYVGGYGSIELHPNVCDCSSCIKERQDRHERDCRRLEIESDNFTMAKMFHEAAALGVDVPSGVESSLPSIGDPFPQPPSAPEPKPETWRDRPPLL